LVAPASLAIAGEVTLVWGLRSRWLSLTQQQKAPEQKYHRKHSRQPSSAIILG
jgi:hypothetical protein